MTVPSSSSSSSSKSSPSGIGRSENRINKTMSNNCVAFLIQLPLTVLQVVLTTTKSSSVSVLLLVLVQLISQQCPFGGFDFIAIVHVHGATVEEYNEKCRAIESELNDETIQRQEDFFSLVKQPWKCICVNSTSIALQEFGEAAAGCNTGPETVCLIEDDVTVEEGSDPIEPFLGTLSILEIFNFTDEVFNGPVSNTQIGHLSQQCFEYYELYNKAVVCLNYDERTDTCGVQINGWRCLSCERYGPTNYYVDCTNIGEFTKFNSTAETLRGTILRFLYSPLTTSRECTSYPQHCDYIETYLNENIGMDGLEPFSCYCEAIEDGGGTGDAAVLTTNTAICRNGQVECLQLGSGSGDNSDSFSGVFTVHIIFESITENILSMRNCFHYAAMYESVEVCIIEEENVSTCSMTVDGSACAFCSICDMEGKLYQFDCSNVIPNKDHVMRLDQCSADDTSGGDLANSILRFHDQKKPLKKSESCPALPSRGQPYQGVFAMSNQLDNEILVFKITDGGYLEPMEVYATGGLGYPYKWDDKNSNENGGSDVVGNSLGAGNSLAYHVWDDRQWLTAVNPGGPNSRSSVSLFEVLPDLTLNQKVTQVVSGAKFPCSVTAHEDRVCVLGCGGSLTVHCFRIDNDPVDRLVLAHSIDLGLSIPEDPNRANAPPVSTNGGGNLLFSPDGSYLGVLFKALPTDNDPAGLYIIPVDGASYGDYTFIEQNSSRASFTFGWGSNSNAAYVVNARGDPDRNASSISVVELDDEGVWKETGNIGIEGGRASFIEYLDGTIYTGNLANWVKQSSISVIPSEMLGDESGISGMQVFQEPDVAAGDIVISGSKLTGESYIHVELHGMGRKDDERGSQNGNKNMIGTYKISREDGSLSFVSYTPFPGAIDQWANPAGIAATRLPEAELQRLYGFAAMPVDVSTPTTSAPTEPPVSRLVPVGSASSLSWNPVVLIVGCILLPFCFGV